MSALIFASVSCVTKDSREAGQGWRERPYSADELQRVERLIAGDDTAEGYDERSRLSSPSLAPLAFADVAPLVGFYDLVPGWGLSWNDFDSDGDHDLFVAHHMHYPSRLYVNEDGLFLRPAASDLGTAIGLDDHVGVWADFDGDGDSDLFTANGFFRPDRLMANLGEGRFEEQSETAGIRFGAFGRGRSAIWEDLNGDGWSDLLVLNLLSPDMYYESLGDGRFSEVSVPRGLQNFLVKEGAVAGDLDGDGDSDLYYPLQRPHQRNMLLLNRGDGRFIESSHGSGADLEGVSYACALGDYDDDGDLDIFVARANGEGDVLLRNRGDATFEDVSSSAGLDAAAFGVRNAGFEDLDNDGDLDIYATAGGALDGRNQANALWLNRGDGTFEEVTGPAGAEGAATGNTAAAAFGDFDGDGLVDIAVTNGAGAVAISGPHQLLKNISGLGARPRNHWLRVLPVRTSGSRAGQGARVRVRLPDGKSLHRIAGPIRTMAQDAPGAHFGLGNHDHVAEVRVSWPDGTAVRMQGVPTGSAVTVVADGSGNLLRSHPASLLGRVPGPDLEAIANRLEDLHPATASATSLGTAFEFRRQELLAYALAYEIADSLSVTEAEVGTSYRNRLADFQLPPRVWIDQIAAGHFTMFPNPPPLPEEAARKALAGLADGSDALTVMQTAGIRAWARVFRSGSMSEPELGAPDDTVRGYLESGWLTAEMAIRRYGGLASQVVSIREGETLGPVALREGRDVQPEDKVWPILRLFRSGTREKGSTLELQFVEATLERLIFRSKLERALRNAEGSRPRSLREVEGTVHGVGFALETLAEAAVERGLHRRADVRAALERIQTEVRIDRSLADLVASARVPETNLASHLARRRAQWTEPERIAGYLLFFLRRDDATRVLSSLRASDAPVETAIQRLEIPALFNRSSRSNEAWTLPVQLDAALATRVFGPENTEVAFQTAPGQVSEVLPAVGGNYLLVVKETIASNPPTEQEARGRALRELERKRGEHLVDLVLFGRTRSPVGD